jgi:glycosyltransferase involved in cell wall biosynthesis
MRIIQVIDSLEIGGAERMAVNYANALSKKIVFSGLVATRNEGSLLNQIDQNVSYLFLNKKKKIDFKAVFRLRKYIKQNRVDFIHAHSSSFFIAVLVKLTMPKIKIIWHDHYGSRSKESKAKNKVLIFMSLFFYSIFVVNLQLKEWSKKNMICKRIFFIPNFTLETKDLQPTTILKGKEGKRIVFLANLKKPKNHILILEAFFNLKLHDLGWSLHLIGKDYLDSYSDKLKNFITSNFLENYIYLYGEKSDVKHILSQVSIGVLASTEEGFPVTLLEYALEELPVICTNVGYCSSLIEDGFTGLLFDPYSYSEIQYQLMKLTDNSVLRKELGLNFKQSVLRNYSEDAVINKLILAYKK